MIAIATAGPAMSARPRSTPWASSQATASHSAETTTRAVLRSPRNLANRPRLSLDCSEQIEPVADEQQRTEDTHDEEQDDDGVDDSRSGVNGKIDRPDADPAEIPTPQAGLHGGDEAGEGARAQEPRR